MNLRKIEKDNLVSNLSGSQFDGAPDVEEAQRRRFKRKHEAGFVGAGYNYWNYPYMVGTLGAGSLITTAQEHEQLQESQERPGDADDQTAPTTTGMSEGGTAASASGAAGGGMP